LGQAEWIEFSLVGLFQMEGVVFSLVEEKIYAFFVPLGAAGNSDAEGVCCVFAEIVVFSVVD